MSKNWRKLKIQVRPRGGKQMTALFRFRSLSWVLVAATPMMVALAGPTIARAQTITACVKNANDDPIKLGTSVGCKSNQHAVTWSITGPAGAAGPAGPAGPAG